MIYRRSTHWLERPMAHGGWSQIWLRQSPLVAFPRADANCHTSRCCLSAVHAAQIMIYFDAQSEAPQRVEAEFMPDIEPPERVPDNFYLFEMFIEVAMDGVTYLVIRSRQSVIWDKYRPWSGGVVHRCFLGQTPPYLACRGSMCLSRDPRPHTGSIFFTSLSFGF